MNYFFVILKNFVNQIYCFCSLMKQAGYIGLRSTDVTILTQGIMGLEYKRKRIRECF